jgi:hypothetical protein
MLYKGNDFNSSGTCSPINRKDTKVGTVVREILQDSTLEKIQMEHGHTH